MAAYFLDTSALARRYLPETGADWVSSWIVPAARNEIAISALAIVEMASLLARRRQEGTVSAADFTTLYGAFLAHAETQYFVVGLTGDVLRRAATLVAQHPLLRSLDAVQLACALAFAETRAIRPTFVSGDKRLLAAAAAEGLPVDDPNAHP